MLYNIKMRTFSGKPVEFICVRRRVRLPLKLASFFCFQNRIKLFVLKKITKFGDCKTFTVLTIMRKGLIFIFIFLIAACNSFAQTEKPAQIAWDIWGVPHISANNTEDLFFAQGWAQMHNHANLILKLYGSSRGKGAEYWGKERLQNDMLIHTMGFEELAETWEAQQDPEVRTIFSSFVRGLNAYAKAHPEAIDKENKVVLPITTRDVNMHSMFVVFTRFIAGDDLGLSQRWGSTGSNAFAVGPSRSDSGNAMLVQNPHLPWSNEFLFFESHLTLNGYDMYGSTLVGLPGISIGFNKNLGWTHTNNTIDNADLYEVELKDGGYLLDGKRNDFNVTTKIIRVKQDDGALVPTEISVLKTVHGPVVAKKDNKVLALRTVGLDKPNMLLQWWRMANSTNFDEFESALKMAQIGFWNVIYADKKGNIFYLFNGLVPKRSHGDWAYWNSIVPGGKSDNIWTEVHPYEDLPKLKNPETGWVQNANDPPWTSTIPMALNPRDYPSYMAPQWRISFRPQRAIRMMMEDSSITFDELVDYKLSTRSELADRILDDLFAAIDKSNSPKAKEARAVLEKWDRQADADSKGTLLFYLWASKFNIGDPSNYTVKWSMEHPNTTPDGISDPAKAVRLLEATVDEMKTRFGRLDVPWGDFYRLRQNGKDLPANGAFESLGVFRVASSYDSKDAAQMHVGSGDSWVGVIEFGENVKAKVLLSYGNATQKDSPHNGDQLELFSKKELRDAWFTPEQVKAHTKKLEVLTEEGFREAVKK